MDPFSITASCISLVDIITRASISIIGFAEKYREAGKDLDDVSKELFSLKQVLGALHADAFSINGPVPTPPPPSTIVMTLREVLRDCEIVVQEIDRTVKECESGRLGSIKWVTTGKAKVQDCKHKLESYKSTLSISVDIISLFRAHNILETTSAMRQAQSQIQDDLKNGIAKILEELHNLHTRVRQQQSHSKSSIVEGWLHHLDSCAQSIYEASTSEDSIQALTINTEHEPLLSLSQPSPVFPLPRFLPTTHLSTPPPSPPLTIPRFLPTTYLSTPLLLAPVPIPLSLPTTLLSTSPPASPLRSPLLIQGQCESDMTHKANGKPDFYEEWDSEDDTQADIESNCGRRQTYTRVDQMRLDEFLKRVIPQHDYSNLDTQLSDLSRCERNLSKLTSESKPKHLNVQLTNITPSTTPAHIRQLVEHGACPNYHFYEKRIFEPNGAAYTLVSPLANAVYEGNLRCARTLIDLGAKVDGPEFKHSVKPDFQFLETPLVMAIRLQDLSMISLLLETGVDVNYINSTIYHCSKIGNAGYVQADTPALFKAVRALIRQVEDYPVNLSILKMLLEAGAEVNILHKMMYENGETTYHSILQHICLSDRLCDPAFRLQQDAMKVQIAKLLCEHGAHVNRPLNSSWVCSLQSAIRDDNVGLAELLLDHGADVNEVFFTNGEIESIVPSEYLDKKPDDLIPEWDFPTPLIAAASQQNIAAIQLLCSRGADANLEDPLHWMIDATCCSGHEDLIIYGETWFLNKGFRTIRQLKHHGASIAKKTVFTYLAEPSEVNELDRTSSSMTPDGGMVKEELSVVELTQRIVLSPWIDRNDLLSVLLE